MNPAPQLRGPFTTVEGLSWRTTNAGRLAFSVPRPYETQEPSDGRPASVDPVFIWQTPPEWLMPSWMHERRTARSSAHCATCGYQSEIQRPPFPYRAHFRFDARSGALYSPIAVRTGLKLGGSGFPASSFSFGLGSNVSIALGPPSINRKITLFARAA